MRRSVFWSWAASLALAGAGFAAAGEPAKLEEPAAKTEDSKKGPGGRLSVEQDVVDVGAVVRGEMATATFVLKNNGTEDLKILSAKPG